MRGSFEEQALALGVTSIFGKSPSQVMVGLPQASGHGQPQWACQTSFFRVPSLAQVGDALITIA